MTRAPILLLLALAGCGRDSPDAGSPDRSEPAVAAAPTEATPPAAAGSAGREEGRGAIVVLRRYYDHIEAGRYRDAWAMRSASDEGLERFTQNFAAYDRYQVTLGNPTEPVQAEGWRYVEVPIQILGTLKGGKGFGSVGSVTMRRATTAKAEPAQREWHIYTG